MILFENAKKLIKEILVNKFEPLIEEKDLLIDFQRI